MTAGTLYQGLRAWPLFYVAGVLGFMFFGFTEPKNLPVLAGRPFHFYVVWASLLFLVLGTALGLITFMCKPKRAVLGMTVGALLWYAAIGLPDTSITIGLRNDILISIFGGYMLVTGILAVIAHALSDGANQSTRFTDLHPNARNSSSGQPRSTEKVFNKKNNFAASALAASGIAAASTFDDDDTDMQTGPVVNIDGTPMIGNMDINGNPYGVTSREMFDGLSVNIDGSPMFDGIDIHGNPFGMTSHDDHFMSSDSFSSDSFDRHSF